VITPFDFEFLTKKVSERLYQGTSKSVFNKTHRDLAKFGNKKTKRNKAQQKRILEIGAGSGEFYDFIHKDFKEYFMTDISEWGKEEILKLVDKDPRVKFEVQDVEKLRFDDNYFDRVVVSCVIAHVTEPYKALEEIKRVTKPNGVISIFISSDPSIMLRLVRKLLIQKKMKNLPIPYKLINSIQHRNSPTTILNMAEYIFKQDQVKVNYLPFYVKSWNLSTHLILNVVKS
jgi:ubiquinone/menaquinone biosynthesis C-methylase UbiE